VSVALIEQQLTKKEFELETMWPFGSGAAGEVHPQSHMTAFG